MTFDVDHDLIDDRVAELARRLDGSRRTRSDLLREVRHGLVDTADAYRASGLPPAEATRHALAEFGDPVALAPEFQVELASRQTRLALGFLAVSAPVTEVVSRVQWSNSPLPYERPPEYTFVLAWLLDAQAWAGSLIAVGVLLAMGFGIGRFHFRARLGQVVGYGIGAHVVVATGVGWLVAMLFEPQSTSTGAVGVVWMVLYSAPGVYLAWLAWRCLRTAGRAARLAT
ncbi:MAG TPA: hypothetical protein H9881_09450 [Candidatus Stackebrandtia excrementipullorum]|nr:hypothetical protein [Candidatus Stackebrandtia excrementipullorum]